MALRGRKPKPAALKLILNNPGRRPLPDASPQEAAGPLLRPRHLKGRALEIWSEVAAAAWWLSGLDSFKLHMFCCLRSELERGASAMSSARLGQLRGVASELGFDPSSRARIGVLPGSRPVAGAARRQADASHKYFKT